MPPGIRLGLALAGKTVREEVTRESALPVYESQRLEPRRYPVERGPGHAFELYFCDECLLA